jgi:rhodanese-related sulfurtransferase
MKKLIFILLAALLLTACVQEKDNDREAIYMNITAQEAKEIMDTQEGYIILDVREQDEFDQGHIPGAILIPYTQIDFKAEDMLPDLDQLILVYCRSGRRSKISA